MLNLTTFSEYSEYLTRKDRLSDSQSYREVLSDCFTSLDDFETCLSEEDEWDIFQTSLENIRDGWTTLEGVAYRWAIPVIMVKYYFHFL